MLTMMLAAKEGCYHDAIHTKRAELWLVIHNLFGGRNREACKLFNLYRVRARVSGIDRTEYVTTEGEVSRRNDFATHWGQRLSAAIVEADAARALALVDKEMAEHRPSALDVLIDGARRAAAAESRPRRAEEARVRRRARRAGGVPEGLGAAVLIMRAGVA